MTESKASALTYADRATGVAQPVEWPFASAVVALIELTLLRLAVPMRAASLALTIASRFIHAHIGAAASRNAILQQAIRFAIVHRAVAGNAAACALLIAIANFFASR